MKSKRSVGTIVITAVVCAVFSAVVSADMVFEDFEGFTAGDDWKEANTRPADWALSPTNFEDVGIVDDNGNNVLYIHTGDTGSSKPTVVWTTGDAWTGSFTASADICLIDIGSSFWFQFSKYNTDTEARVGARVYFSGNEGSVTSRPGSFGDTGESAKTVASSYEYEQWYRIFLDFTIAVDPEDSMFDVRMYEIPHGGGALGTLVGSSTDNVLPGGIGVNEFYYYNTDDTHTRKMYFDDITIIPEPGTLALLLLGAGAVAMRRRR